MGEFIILNKNTGVNSGDVVRCNDEAQLNEWLMEQELDLASMNMQLTQADEYRLENGEYMDEGHYTKLRKALYLQEELRGIMIRKLDSIKSKKQTLQSTVLKILKREMTDKEWDGIVEQAKLELSLESNTDVWDG